MLFEDKELACKHCGMLILHPGFRETLVFLRETFNKPMIVRSCCRCKEHNDSEAVKGHPESMHICDFPAHKDKGQRGTASIDIETPDGAYRGELFALAWKLGWSIGWNAKSRFLHLDRRDWFGFKQTSFDY